MFKSLFWCHCYCFSFAMRSAFFWVLSPRDASPVCFLLAPPGEPPALLLGTHHQLPLLQPARNLQTCLWSSEIAVGRSIILHGATWCWALCGPLRWDGSQGFTEAGVWQVRLLWLLGLLTEKGSFSLYLWYTLVRENVGIVRTLLGVEMTGPLHCGWHPATVSS